MSDVAVVIGYVCFVAYVFYLSHDLMGKPKNDVESLILKWLQPQHIAIFIRITGMWLVVAGISLLAIMSSGTNYEALMTDMVTISVLTTGGVSLIYLVLYVTFQITTNIEKLGNWRYK